MIRILLALGLLLFPAGQDADLKQLVRDARSKDSSVRLPTFTALIELGPEGIRLLEPILRDAEVRARKEFRSALSSPRASAFRKSLKKQLQEARREALEIIADRKLYPDDAHGAVGQAAVDSKVAQLRMLWNSPGRLFLERMPELNETLYYIKEAAQYLKRAGLQPHVYDEDLDAAYKELNEAFCGLPIMYSPSEQKQIEELREYNVTCACSATDEERRFCRILNDYRIMLGLCCLELDDRLLQAARKHSQEMLELDYFAHISPVSKNRTPATRAQQEGYGGGVLENCAISGDAQDAFDGWYNSSGHHRGLVSSGVTQLGTSHAVTASGGRGRQWTMLAGSANSLRGKSKRDDPRLTYLARAKTLQTGDADTRYLLARYCQKHDLADEARQLLEEVVALEPDHRKAHLLLGHVKSGDRWVTAEALLLEKLDLLGEEAVLGDLAEQLKAEEAASRLAAVEVLRKIQHANGGMLLISALKDQASEVRAAACAALADRQEAGAVGPLTRTLKDTSFYVAHSAAAALWKLGDRAGVPVLFAGLRSGDLNTRIDAHRKARSCFGEDFGYAWDLPAVRRAQVVDEWEAWVASKDPS
ncbi:MAG: CAP domain-containing protein [Planctomycetota bacterium]